jgi:hypothetical protein
MLRIVEWWRRTLLLRRVKAVYMFIRSFRLLAILSAVLFLISAASDWPLGVLKNFWSSHSLLTNLYSEALFVVIGISVIEHYLHRRNDRRLALVAAVASDAAGRGPLSQWRTMWFLVNGGEYISDLDFPISSARIKGIRNALQRNGFPEVKESEVRAASAPLPDLTERLTLLTTDRQWVSLAYSILREFTFRFRILIARWSPLLASTTESGDVLLDLAAQAQELTDLFIRLRPIAMEGRSSLTPDEFVQLIEHWRMALCNAIAMDHALAHFSGQPSFPWSTGSRLLLAEADRQLATNTLYKRTGTMRIYSRVDGR